MALEKSIGTSGKPVRVTESIILKNTNHVDINPATEDKQDTLITHSSTIAGDTTSIDSKINNEHEHIKMIGYHESIGHLSTTTGGITIERANGHKTTIGTGNFTLLESSTFIQPAGDTQMYISSTSTNDVAGGSGLQGLTMEYFPNAWGARLFVNFATSGSSLTALPVSNVYRIHKLYGYLGAPAEGNITITGAGGTILYGQIDQYETFMDRCIFYVAENESVTCTEAFISSTTGGGVLFRFFATEEDASGNIITRGRIPMELESTTSVLPFVISETVTNPNNLRKALGLAVKAAGVASNQSASGSLKGFRETI